MVPKPKPFPSFYFVCVKPLTATPVLCNGLFFQLSKCRSYSISTVDFNRQISFPPTPWPAFAAPNHKDPFHRIFNALSDRHRTYLFCSKALKFSAQMGFLRTGKPIHSHIIKLGLYNFLALQNQILNLYVKFGEFFDALRLFDEMRVRNVVTWNTVFCGVVDSSSNYSPENLFMVFCYFRRMLVEMVSPDRITFTGLLRWCIELNDIETGKQLHCFVVKLGFDLDCFASSALVDFYGKCGLVEDARRVFDNVSNRDLVLWNMMVSCYALNGLAVEALGVYNLMQLDGMKGDDFTFPSLLSSCGALGCSELGKQIHGIIIRHSFDLDILVASALVDMYAKNENIEDARKAFDGMTIRNVVSWTTMIVGYGRHGDGKEAMRLLQEMFRDDFNPDELTLASVISSCGNTSATSEMLQVHAHTIKIGFHAFLSISNALINAYSKCGSIGSAFQCFSSVVAPDLVTWTSIICACAFHGLAREAIEFFKKLFSNGVRPDRIAFLGVLSSCSHRGLVNEGLHYFSSMVNDYQIVPDSEHYTCLIDLLGRAGLLDEAFSVLTSMPFEPGSDTLGAFIGACKLHGNVELAKWAAEMLFALEPANPVNYILVSNMYASEGHWFDVKRVRKMMRDRCHDKFPGSSWLEIAGEVHTFASSDKSHPQALEVYVMLGMLLRLMKKDNLVSNIDTIFDSDLD